jgi:hypothetical protein
MSKWTHYVRDKEHPARVTVVQAVDPCTICGKTHLKKDGRVSVMPWVMAVVIEKLKRISDIPPKSPH